MILCTHCGHQNQNQGRFCTACGNRLEEERLVVGRLYLLGEGEKREYLLAGAERFIGRDERNDIVLDDEQVSSRHARIHFAEEAFWVEDLESTNGTFVNGRRIAEATRLRGEDLLKLGRTLLKFHI